MLIGSGLSHAVHWIATEQPMPGMSVFDFQVFKDQLAAGAPESAKSADAMSETLKIRFALGMSYYVDLRFFD